MVLKGKNILITGGGGFIGSHLVERLVHLGANVTVFLRYNSREDEGLIKFLSLEVRENINIIWGDLRSIQSVKIGVKEKDIIFHLGALISVPYSYVNPQDVIETNILGVINILDAAREYGVEKVIHTSTSEVYGTALYTPIDEEHPLQAQSPYSASKIGADKICESYFKSFDLPVTILRPFNTYGPRQSARAVIPCIISQALQGETVKIGALTPTRDFTFISDLIDGFIEIGKADNVIGETINVGFGEDISIKELISLISELMKKRINIQQEKERMRPPKSEVMRLVADTTKAKRLLGWRPKVTLEKGLLETIKWIKEHMYLYKTQKYTI
jgi:NAD dependent epimerase/dehydratase